MRSNPRTRGVTLLELVVAAAIGMFLTTAAIVFATRQTRMLTRSSDALDMQQSGRAILDMLFYDLQLAGAGIGNDTLGNYAGLQTGPGFRAIGGLLMNSSGSDASGAYTEISLRRSALNNAETDAVPYTMRTEDLGIILADEAYASIALHSGTYGQYCDDGTVLSGTATRYAVIEDNVRLGLMSVLFTPGVTEACAYGFCLGGCRAFTLAPDPTSFYESTANAGALNYTSGEVRTGLKQIVWFVENDPLSPATASLRRAELTGLDPVANPGNQCAGSRAACGSEVAFNVDSLQYQLWRFDPGLVDDASTNRVDERWVAINAPVFQRPTGNRLRVDVEVVVRSARQYDRPVQPAALTLRPGVCAPGVGPTGACGSPGNSSEWDFVSRRVHRLSVEVKNSW